MTSGAPTHGCQIILVNDRAEVLLFLRDDKAWIPYPDTWCLPGGHLEAGETPLQCIVREVEEEMGIRLRTADVHLLYTMDRSYGTEHTFWARLDVDAADIDLTEGQAVSWFSRDQVGRMRLGYEDDDVLRDFFGGQAPTGQDPGR